MCKGPRHVPHAILPIINAGHQEASLRPLPRNPHRFLVAFVHQGGEATAVHVDNHRQWVTGTGTVEIHEQLCGLTIEVCVPILHILLFYCVPGFGATRGVGRTGNRTAMGQGAQHPKKHLRRHVWTGRSGVVECPLKPAAKLPKKTWARDAMEQVWLINLNRDYLRFGLTCLQNCMTFFATILNRSPDLCSMMPKKQH